MVFFLASCSKKKEDCESCQVNSKTFHAGNLIDSHIVPIPCGAKPGTTTNRTSYNGITTVIVSTISCK